MSIRYFIIRYLTLGPVFRMMYRIKVSGRKNIPRKGKVILAANHQAGIDSAVIMLLIRRAIVFLAKKEYFSQPGLVGWLKMQFFSVAAIPVDRNDSSDKSGDELILHLEDDEAVAVHPEGTRILEDRVIHRGKTGTVILAQKTGAPVVPIFIEGTNDVRLGGTIRVVVGKPIYCRPPAEGEAPQVVRRAQTKDIMLAIVAMAGDGWTYVDTDAPRKPAAA